MVYGEKVDLTAIIVQSFDVVMTSLCCSSNMILYHFIHQYDIINV